MINKTGRLIKTVLSVLAVFVLIFSTQISSFAIYYESPYKYNDKTNYEIVGLMTWLPKGEITIPSKATGIKSGAFKNSSLPLVNVSKITKVTISSGVRYIENGAFSSDCTSLKQVVIQNAKSKINVGESAFPKGAIVTYTIEETTVPPTTEAPTEPPTTKQPDEPTTQPAAEPTTNNLTTTRKSEKATTTEPTTGPEVTEPQVPLSDYTAQFPEFESWESIVSPSEEVEEFVATQSKPTSNSSVARYAANTSIVVVTFTAIIMTYFKFKK